jgi:hypothetical protein
MQEEGRLCPGAFSQLEREGHQRKEFSVPETATMKLLPEGIAIPEER